MDMMQYGNVIYMVIMLLWIISIIKILANIANCYQNINLFINKMITIYLIFYNKFINIYQINYNFIWFLNKQRSSEYRFSRIKEPTLVTNLLFLGASSPSFRFLAISIPSRISFFSVLSPPA